MFNLLGCNEGEKNGARPLPVECSCFTNIQNMVSNQASALLKVINPKSTNLFFNEEMNEIVFNVFTLSRTIQHISTQYMIIILSACNYYSTYVLFYFLQSTFT